MIFQECLSHFHTVAFYVAQNTKTKIWVFKKVSFSTYVSGNSWLAKKKKRKKLVTKWNSFTYTFQTLSYGSIPTLNKQIK